MSSKITENQNFSDFKFPKSDYKFPKFVPCKEAVERVQALIIKEYTTYDTFGNCLVDLRKAGNSFSKEEKKAFKVVLPELVKKETENKKHVFLLHLSNDNPAAFFKYARKAGFVFHQANPQFAIFEKCLKNHELSECNYPVFKTVSVGVTVVVFDKTLEKILTVQENSGPYRGKKPVTGTVDYEHPTSEGPFHAALREVEEETGVKLDPKNGKFVGMGWTQFFRGNNPDISCLYAFQAEGDEKLHAQEKEIEKVSWTLIKELLNEEIVREGRPLVFQSMIKVALEAIKNNTGWTASDNSWGSGKHVVLYGHNSKL